MTVSVPPPNGLLGSPKSVCGPAETVQDASDLAAFTTGTEMTSQPTLPFVMPSPAIETL